MRLQYRYDLINALIDFFGYESYLEIGCWHDDCFSRVSAPIKVGVDPRSGGTVRATSDEFFEDSEAQFDIVFVDGLHLAEQVVRDVYNSALHLRDGGVIVMHDCNPGSEEEQGRERRLANRWNGDVWKAMVYLRTMPWLDCLTMDMDSGCGIVALKSNTKRLELGKNIFDLGWGDLTANRKDLLRLTRPDFDIIKPWLSTNRFKRLD